MRNAGLKQHGTLRREGEERETKEEGNNRKVCGGNKRITKNRNVLF